MENNTRTLDFSLRFISVSIPEVQPILDGLPSDIARVRPYHKDKSKMVIVLDLKESLDYEALSASINQNADGLDYDIFVSVRSESDSEIIDIPDHVVGLVRETKSRLTFSFTIV